MGQRELEMALYSAVREAETRRHEYVTVEHLLFALIHEPVARKILRHCGVKLKRLTADLEKYLNEEIDQLPDGVKVEPMQTMGFQRVLQRAMMHVRSSGKAEIDGGNVLVAIFAESDSHAVFILEKHNVRRLDVVSYISHGVSKVDDDELEGGELTARETDWEDDEEEDEEDDKPLQDFMVNLTERAREGRIDPLIGRDQEVERVIQVLCRRRKNNPLLAGDPGVGKTAIVEGLARKVVHNEVPEVLRGVEVYSLDLGSLLAGTKFRGQFEERLKGAIKALVEEDNAILFIDEIHMIVGAGATAGGSMDASNLLKPALQRGDLRCIGATTHQDYKRSFERDRALARRFQKIDVLEPSVEDTFQILKGLKPYYEEYHEVSYTEEALRAAADLAARFINERYLPDKAIDVIDEAGARNRMKAGEARKETLDNLDIEAIVARIARMPEITASLDERDRLASLGERMKGKVFGQDQAVEAVVNAVKLSRAGLAGADKPVGSFLFTGPTGVGKTEVAKQLADALAVEFIRFDMSEYMEKHTVSRLLGAPPGYVGYDQGGLLTEAIRKNPHSVLLLDEIEKAHPDLFNILLQVMDHATLTDNNGREADFRNVIIIMTSNAGAFEMTRRSVGFGKGVDVGQGEKALERLFSPEFRNRLDSVITFSALPGEVMTLVVDKFIAQLGVNLAERDVSISLTDAARVWLADHGYDEQFGARPLSRLIQTTVRQPLAEELLFGALKDGGHVTVDHEDDAEALSFHFEQEAHLPDPDGDERHDDDGPGDEPTPKDGGGPAPAKHPEPVEA